MSQAIWEVLVIENGPTKAIWSEPFENREDAENYYDEVIAVQLHNYTVMVVQNCAYPVSIDDWFENHSNKTFLEV